jgi:hypothetical protein
MSNIDANNDTSVMIKLTPTEIKNILRDFADRWSNAQKNNTTYSLRDLCDTYYNLSIGLLEQTDPDRFIHSN